MRALLPAARAGDPLALTLRSPDVLDAATRVLAFISAYMVGGLEGHYYPELYRPDCIAIDDTIRAARENADLVRGVKGHAEIGGFTRWGDEAMRRAAEISRSLMSWLGWFSPQSRTFSAPGHEAASRTRASWSSGTEKTMSRGPSTAMLNTGVPAPTTMPGSANTPVTTPGASASSWA